MAGQQLFAVIRTRAAGWDGSRPLEGQPDWAGHALFMNGLAKEGFVVLGGPLDGTPDVLLIIRAKSSEEIVARLAADPWTTMDLLRVVRITPWNLRLGSIA